MLPENSREWQHESKYTKENMLSSHRDRGKHREKLTRSLRLGDKLLHILIEPNIKLTQSQQIVLWFRAFLKGSSVLLMWECEEK